MKLTSLVVVGGMLLFGSSSLAAQMTGTPAADPVSGAWTGQMGRGNDSGMPITVTLKFDGNTVTGTIQGPPSPGIIRKGSFDKQTGALKFEVEVQDSARTIAVFEGRIVGDSASGSVSLNNQTGTFKLTRGTAASTSAAAPQAEAPPLASLLQKSFEGVSGHITKSAEMIPAEKYSYQPAKTVRTVGQLIAHIADGYNYFCAVASGRKVEWTDAAEKGATDKAAVTAKLKQATDACSTVYGSGAQPHLIENLNHTNLHYGNLITYMRLLGLVPPSS